MKSELVSICFLSFVVSLAASNTESIALSSTGCESCQESNPTVSGDEGTVSQKPQEQPLPDDVSSLQASPGNDQTSVVAAVPNPWSYEPVCTDYLPGLNGTLCVYTNASFSNGRGISIFTTPSIATEFASLLPFQDPMALPSHGINPSPESDRPWTMAALPGKGIGMLASRPLQRGDLITAYTPYLLAHMENVLSTTEREKFLRIAVDQLPQSSRHLYFNLATIYNEPSVIVQDVVKANAFEMQVGGQMHLAVFPETSRMNHACAPNAQYYLSPNLLTHFVHAARAIAPGEEITISYSPPLQFHAQRQTYLEETFHFTCTCSRCQSDPSISDKAVSDILALQWALGNWEADSTASVKKAEMLVRLYQDEGLEAFLDTAYGHAALTYNAVGSARGAKKYAKLAAEAAVLKYGPEAPGLEDWGKLVRDPMGHSSWRRRKAVKAG